MSMFNGTLNAANGSAVLQSGDAHGVHQSRGSEDSGPLDDVMKSNAVIELDGNIGLSERICRNLGFLLCEPPYNKDGALPMEGEHNGTKVDIIGVAAVGADAKKSWVNNPRYSKGTEFEAATQALDAGLWITRNIRKDIPDARVLLYDGHAMPQEGENLQAFARRFLKSLHGLRTHDKTEKRPYFIICHSTGGLVAKLALLNASRGSPNDKALLADCYGISFLATPHQGSSYLSAPEFTTSIRTAMKLQSPLPQSLQDDLRINSRLLQHMASDFKRLAADLVVWTFYETKDTDLTIPMTAETEEIPILAPIASIKSAILDLYHELDFPLWTDHVGCASFSGDNSEARQDFLRDLEKAVKQAIFLSSGEHAELKIKEKVEVEIHGFYKGIPQPTSSEAPIRLWSIRKGFQEFVRLGPSKCLEERLAEVSPPPPVTQLIQSLSTRAPSLDNRMANNRPFMPSSLASLKSRRDEGEISSKAVEQRQLSLPSEDEESFPAQGTRKAVKKRIVEFLTANEISSKTNGSSSRSARRASLQEYKGPFSSRPPQRQVEAIQDTTINVSTPNLIISNPVDSGSVDLPDAKLVEGPLPNSAGLRPAAALRPNLLHNSSMERLANLQPQPKHLTTMVQANQSPSSYPLVRPKIEDRMSLPRTAEERYEQNDESLLPNKAPASRFVKPDVADRKLTWIHVPFNNPRCTLGEGHSGSTVPLISSSGLVRYDPADLHIALHLPYLHWDTYKLLVRRRGLVKERLEYNRSRPVPEYVSKMDYEHQVTWHYLGRDPPFNCRRTLDQYGYPNLHDTRARDDDQMLYKMTKKRKKPNSSENLKSRKSFPKHKEQTFVDKESSEDEDIPDEEGKNLENDVLDGTVLMVDQLWLWVVNSDTTVTFFPRGESKPIDGRLHQQADLRNSIYNEVNADLATRCENSLDLAALVALHAITVLLERSSHSDLEVFRIFEESISILVEKMTKSFKDFRSLGFRDKSTEYDSDDIIMSIKDRHKREGRLSEKQNRDDTSAMLELRDIHDELDTLQKLFNEQKDTIEQMVDVYKQESYRQISRNGLTILYDAQEKLKEYTHQVDQMIKNASRTRTDFEKLLDLKQRQANVDEARLARYQADVTSVQSRAVMVFTVFTVLFVRPEIGRNEEKLTKSKLPLTFFTGLFGMNISEWSGTSTNVNWRTVVTWSIPLSLTIVVCALALALSAHVRKFAVKAGQAAAKLFSYLASLCMVVAFAITIPLSIIASWSPAPTTKKKHRIRNKKLRKHQKDDGHEDFDDFWGNHVEQREKEYRIPPHNRKFKPKKMRSATLSRTFGLNQS
ncbi:hypothetical protein MMC11_003975 [Xylographa trunciseda]|nr:hypothetical protein [Xylographa trunciseda]